MRLWRVSVPALSLLLVGAPVVELAPSAASGPDFLSRAQAHIAAREYWASETRDGLQAPNREHDLRTWFEPSGVRVHARTRGDAAKLVALRLARLGRGDALADVAPGAVTSHESRVEIRREEAGLVEWYVNSPAGLEQGFTLAERPAAQATGELVFELAVAGAKATRRGEGVALATAAGRKLAYRKLAATDANGRPLAARMEIPAPDRIQLVVSDAGAAYPLTVDPLLTEAADAQLESDQVDAEAGYGIASAGDVNGDGYADVLVGAFAYDDGQTDEGAAFLFLGGPGGIADGGPADADAVLTGQQAGAFFGYSVASAGDVNGDGYDDVVVGASAYDSGQADEGAAFIFRGSPSGLVGTDPATAATRLEGNQVSAGLGYSVGGAGDVNGDGYADVIVGAWHYDNGQADEGVAWIFHGSVSGIADGNGATAATWLESNQANAVLGNSVASAGDVNADGYDDVIVGAHRYDVTYTDAGVASIFLGSATGVANGTPSTAHANIRGNQASAFMGHSVASAGDVNGDGYADVMASATGYDDGQTDEGIVSILFGGPGGMPGDFTPSSVDDGIASNQAGALLGERLGTVGDVNGDGYADVAVGAHLYDTGQTDEGCAWVFYGGAAGITASPNAETPASADIKLCSDQVDAQFGANVTGAGDVDGDGYADLLVGAYLYDAGSSNEGAVFVYRGGNEGIAPQNPVVFADWDGIFSPPVVGGGVASAGDVNGDGYSDVIVGLPSFDGGVADEGAAFIFLGPSVGNFFSDADATLRSNQTDSGMGTSVASAGDVNGDGYADVIVGAPRYNSGTTDEGAAFVFLGSSTGIADGTPGSAHAWLESNDAGAHLGQSVASAGDVNGDGYSDVIVGAPDFNGDGAAFVFHGSAAGVFPGGPTTADSVLVPDQPSGFGGSVAPAGDVDGDGYADVIVGAAEYTNGEAQEGAAFVFRGSVSGVASGSSASAHARIEADQANASLGASVASAGDVNGDGYADVIVGAPGYDAGQTDEGAAFVFLGSSSGLADGSPSTAHAQLESNVAGMGFGVSAASAGDVDGDGLADVVVGSIQDQEFVPSDAYVFLGSPSGIADGSPATAHSELGLGGAARVASAGDVTGDGLSDVLIGAVAELGYGWTAAMYRSNESSNSQGRVLARQRRGDGSGIEVQPWGDSGAETSFEVELRGSHPDGTGRVREMVEACPAGAAFGSTSCTAAVSAAWTLLVSGTEDAVLTAHVTGLTPGTLYRWRARVEFAPATGPLPAIPAHGPWRRLAAQAFDGDIRTTALAACDNGVDDDGDGYVDYPSDPGCAAAADASENDPGVVCDDGVDNDGDGRVDFPADPGCRLVTSNKENPQCQDGKNNDNQTGIDFDGGASLDINPQDGLIDVAFNPATPPVGAVDPQCTAAWKNKEAASGCGLGFELALLLPLLEARRRRARRGWLAPVPWFDRDAAQVRTSQCS